MKGPLPAGKGRAQGESGVAGIKPTDHIKERLSRLESALGALDALLVTDLNSIRYLSGFTGSSAYVVVSSEGSFFLTDQRYEGQARAEVHGRFKRRIYKKDWLDAVAGVIKAVKPGVLGFEGSHLSYEGFLRLKKGLKRVRLKSTPGIIRDLRKRKDESEIERLRQSAGLLDIGFKEAEKRLANGAIEKEVAFRVECAVRRHGPAGHGAMGAMAFDSIVASGLRGALPHGKASEKKIKKGDLVVVDMGVILNGYNSDETRTYSIGRAGSLEGKVYGVVLKAQTAAIEMLKPGVRASDVDKRARTVIQKAGYGKYFGHSLGHGVGLEVHEGPALSPASKDVLMPGMVVTIEPGIYIPGWGGVRIEDMALITEHGFEILTKTDKGLREL